MRAMANWFIDCKQVLTINITRNMIQVLNKDLFVFSFIDCKPS